MVAMACREWEGYVGMHARHNNFDNKRSNAPVLLPRSDNERSTRARGHADTQFTSMQVRCEWFFLAAMRALCSVVVSGCSHSVSLAKPTSISDEGSLCDSAHTGTRACAGRGPRWTIWMTHSIALAVQFPRRVRPVLV